MRVSLTLKGECLTCEMRTTLCGHYGETTTWQYCRAMERTYAGIRENPVVSSLKKEGTP